MTQVLEPLLLREHRDDVVGRMRQLLAPQTTLAGTIIAYQLGLADRNGAPQDSALDRLIRPSLCLWAVGACGGNANAALPLAVSIELLHNFILIHADIQDGDRVRHQRETAWAIWGVGQGVNAGDALHALAISLLSSSALDEGQALRIFTRVIGAVNETVHGKACEIESEGLLARASRRSLEIAFRKSGALMGACLEAGALAASAPESRVRAFRRAGRMLGVAMEGPSLAERCVARARTIVSASGVNGRWFERFEEMAEYIAKRTR
jgi:geranylgeranyl diphosphate synthase type I